MSEKMLDGQYMLNESVLVSVKNERGGLVRLSFGGGYNTVLLAFKRHADGTGWRGAYQLNNKIFKVELVWVS